LKPFNYFWLKFVKVKVENPVALRFILQDELYLLKTEKPLYENLEITEPEIQAGAPVPSATAPIVTKPQPATVAIPAPEVTAPPIVFNYLGKNQKNFLVLVHYPNLEFIDEAHLTALTNIIKRKDLSLDDIAIVNLAKQASTGYNHLVAFFKPAKLLILGPKSMPEGISPLSLNTPASLGNITRLYSFAFGEMMDNVEYKKAFWEQMKTL
jgi:hypothetical protein